MAKSLKRLVSDTILTLIITSIILSVTTFFFIEPVKVVGNSMEPTLQKGDLTLCVKRALINKGFHTGDIVVSKNPESKTKIVKRIFGLPSETLELKNHESVKIPENGYFLMGDNLSKSYDSRDFGLISEVDISCRVFLIIWPQNAVKIL